MFQASAHGWPFEDSFRVEPAQLGIGAPPRTPFGLSGGMAWAALDRYRRGVAIPRAVTTPPPGSPLHAEFLRRQVAATAGVWPRVAALQSAPSGSWRDALPIPVPGGQDVASRTRAEWPGIRRRLDRDEPVLLTVLADGTPYERPRSVRQLLATGWSREGARVTITVYDPLLPGQDDVLLSFNRAGPLEARISGEPPLRGFFAVEYDRAAPPALRTQAFDDRSVIGLNRRALGLVAGAGARRRLDLAARNERGALLHFYRRDGRHWEGLNVTEAAGFGAYEIHSDPVPIRAAGALHVFACSYVGDLLHFRFGRKWTVVNRTEGKLAGARFRLQGRPVAIPTPRLGLSVIGRDPSGGLIHYMGGALRRWRAEQIPGDPVVEDPVALEREGVLHVVGVAGDGRLLHWAREETWTVTDTGAGPGPQLRLTGPARAALHDDAIVVAGRTEEGELALLQYGSGGLWDRTALGQRVSGPPALCDGPDGLHVFAPTEDGGLLHAWPTPDGWALEDVVRSRDTMPPAPAGAGALAAWGDGSRIRVFIRRDTVLRCYTWTADGDWCVDTLADRTKGTPMLLEKAGTPHVITSDLRGTVLHVEETAWRAPTPASPASDVGLRPGRETGAGEASATSAEPKAETERVATRTADPGTPADGAPEPGDPAPVSAEPGPEPVPAPEAAPVELLEFEMEGRVGSPEPQGTEPATAEPDDEDTSDGPDEDQEYRWTQDDEVPAEDVEPMDLSLLDSWPAPKVRRRGRRANGRADDDGGSAGESD